MISLLSTAHRILALTRRGYNPWRKPGDSTTNELRAAHVRTNQVHVVVEAVRPQIVPEDVLAALDYVVEKQGEQMAVYDSTEMECRDRRER